MKRGYATEFGNVSDLQYVPNRDYVMLRPKQSPLLLPCLPQEILLRIFDYMSDITEAHPCLSICKHLYNIFLDALHTKVQSSFTSDHVDCEHSIQNYVKCIGFGHRYYNPQNRYICRLSSAYLQIHVRVKVLPNASGTKEEGTKVLAIASSCSEVEELLPYNQNTGMYVAAAMMSPLAKRNMMIVKTFLAPLYALIQE
jgi:hypothetical protein